MKLKIKLINSMYRVKFNDGLIIVSRSLTDALNLLINSDLNRLSIGLLSLANDARVKGYDELSNRYKEIGAVLNGGGSGNDELLISFDELVKAFNCVM